MPFITAFATPVLIPEELEAVTEALDAVHFRPSLLSDLVSKDGFVELRPQGD